VRIGVKISLALRFFKRPLASYFLLFAFVSTCIFSLLLVINSYAYQMEERFAAKQPHFTLVLNQDRDTWLAFKGSTQLQDLKKLLENEPNVVAVSEFIKVTKWLRLRAATSQISGFEKNEEFDKFSTGNVTLIGLERQLPAVIPLSQLNYYDSGPYKFKITNLEYASDWLLNPKLILPNAVLDASFYAPITQQVSVKQDGVDYKGQIKAFINDYADESVLYMGINQISHWLDETDIQETGVYIRIHDTSQLMKTKAKLQSRLDLTSHDWLVTSWLEQKNKQKSILIMTQLVAYSLIVLLVVLLLLVLTLNLTNVFIVKAKSLEILFMTGYLLTGPLVFNSLVASVMGLLVGYLFTLYYLESMILAGFGILTPQSYELAWGVCVLTLILVNLINLMGMKNRLGN